MINRLNFLHEIWKKFEVALTWRQANSPDT
jgi:hypothetical protein